MLSDSTFAEKALRSKASFRQAPRKFKHLLAFGEAIFRSVRSIFKQVQSLAGGDD